MVAKTRREIQTSTTWQHTELLASRSDANKLEAVGNQCLVWKLKDAGNIYSEGSDGGIMSFALMNHNCLQ